MTTEEHCAYFPSQRKVALGPGMFVYMRGGSFDIGSAIAALWAGSPNLRALQHGLEIVTRRRKQPFVVYAHNARTHHITRRMVSRDKAAEVFATVCRAAGLLEEFVALSGNPLYAILLQKAERNVANTRLDNIKRSLESAEKELVAGNCLDDFAAEYPDFKYAAHALISSARKRKRTE